MASTVWRGYLSFGLLSIPVRLFRAARAERPSFRMLHRGNTAAPVRSRSAQNDVPPDDKHQNGAPTSKEAESRAVKSSSSDVLTPIHTGSLDANTDTVVPKESVIKGYEYEKDRFVVLEPEELKTAAAKTSAAMEIEECVALDEIDPVYFETSYYVTPEEAGEKAYALLYRSLQDSGLVALAQFAMHGREHVVVLRPGRTGLLAHTMFFEDEVRHDEEYVTDSEGISKKELQLAQTLIQSLANPFDPGKYRDAYRERIEALIESKRKNLPAPAAPALPKAANVVDIAEALRQSLAKLKKPPSSADEASGAKPKRVRSAAQKVAQPHG